MAKANSCGPTEISIKVNSRTGNDTAKASDSIKTVVTIWVSMKKISLQARVDTNGKMAKATKVVGLMVSFTEKE